MECKTQLDEIGIVGQRHSGGDLRTKGQGPAVLVGQASQVRRNLTIGPANYVIR
jgi:hypothetical protein